MYIEGSLWGHFRFDNRNAYIELKFDMNDPEVNLNMLTMISDFIQRHKRVMRLFSFLTTHFYLSSEIEILWKLL